MFHHLRHTLHNRLSHRQQGLLLALAGFSCLAIGDAVVKSVAGLWPGSAFAALRYVLGAAGLTALVAWHHGKAGFVMPRPGIQWARGAAVALATLGFFLGVFKMSLADATTIQFLNPMLTAIISALFLGERISGRNWLAIALAFVGVVIVLRPNVAAFGPWAFFPLMAALAMAGLMIFNRKAAGSAPPLVLQMLIAVLASPILVGLAVLLHVGIGGAEFAITVPPARVVLATAIVAFTGSLAHWWIYMATVRASAATIAPMVYVQLLFATLFGLWLFGDAPDPMKLLGAALIIGAGLIIWHGARNRRV